MSKGKRVSNRISEFLKGLHADALLKTKTRRLQDILTNLRYEGKPFFGKNLKEAYEMMKFFDGEVVAHVDLEEETLFPFLKTRVPKLESVIHLFQAEHEDLKKNVKGFKSLLKELPKERNGLNRVKTIEKLAALGTHLIYLLRNHIEGENRSIYKALDRELRPGERRELARRIEKRKGGGLR